MENEQQSDTGAPCSLAELRRQIVQSLEGLYPAAEAQVLAYMLLQAATGWAKTKVLAEAASMATDGVRQQVERWQGRLAAGEPIQYILGRGHFMGMELRVSPAVLIPRPESEELVAWALELAAAMGKPELRMADACTGSGCLALAWQQARRADAVLAIELSPEALTIAAQNAQEQDLPIHLLQADVLSAEVEKAVMPATLDVLLSNPPYIPEAEHASLHQNVRDHEPHMALFVPDGDPLLFYRRLAQLGLLWLRPGGVLVVELHHLQGPACAALFRQMGLADVELRKAFNGQDRLLMGRNEGRQIAG